jgi:hypothetical protein
MLLMFTTAAQVYFHSTNLLAQTVDYKKVSLGNEQEVKKAFERLVKADGDIAEELDVALGESMATKPEVFLQSLKKYGTSTFRMGALLCNLGPKYVDKMKKQEIELLKRIKILRAIKDQAFKTLVTECLDQLKKCLNQVKK